VIGRGYEESRHRLHSFRASLGGLRRRARSARPVGASEKLILIDSLAIMLAIVIPVILATIGFASHAPVPKPVSFAIVQTRRIGSRIRLKLVTDQDV
jgi:hypothetical protein